MRHRVSRFQVQPSKHPMVLCPLSTFDVGLAALEDERPYWGFFTTPQEAEMCFWSGDAWQRELSARDLLEARIFGSGLDLHWLEDRGVLLTPGALEEHLEVIGGAGWSERERKSRLWGEWLDGGEPWYEERIPRPLRYPGLESSAKNRFPFLQYREFIRAGVVEYVQYLTVKGEA